MNLRCLLSYHLSQMHITNWEVLQEPCALQLKERYNSSQLTQLIIAKLTQSAVETGVLWNWLCSNLLSSTCQPAVLHPSQNAFVFSDLFSQQPRPMLPLKHKLMDWKHCICLRPGDGYQMGEACGMTWSLVLDLLLLSWLAAEATKYDDDHSPGKEREVACGGGYRNCISKYIGIPGITTTMGQATTIARELERTYEEEKRKSTDVDEITLKYRNCLHLIITAQVKGSSQRQEFSHDTLMHMSPELCAKPGRSSDDSFALKILKAGGLCQPACPWLIVKTVLVEGEITPGLYEMKSRLLQSLCPTLSNRILLDVILTSEIPRYKRSFEGHAWTAASCSEYDSTCSKIMIPYITQLTESAGGADLSACCPDASGIVIYSDLVLHAPENENLSGANAGLHLPFNGRQELGAERQLKYCQSLQRAA
ncbi:hypothetical protein Pelo_17328 [Pelomyxa schiedti]|nr:hypothetical protein Pelo_17328 [Pelomyxa schiedti]